MRNAPFVAWMLGFPLMDSLTCLIDVQAGVHVPHDPALADATAWVGVVLWFGVGALLYRRGDA